MACCDWPRGDSNFQWRRATINHPFLVNFAYPSPHLDPCHGLTRRRNRSWKAHQRRYIARVYWSNTDSILQSTRFGRRTGTSAHPCLSDWRVSPFLYDIVVTHALEWPTLTTQWFPDKETYLLPFPKKCAFSDVVKVNQAKTTRHIDSWSEHIPLEQTKITSKSPMSNSPSPVLNSRITMMTVEVPPDNTFFGGVVEVDI